MALGRGQGLVYIGQSINSRPLDQTDLKERRRYNLGGDGKLTYEREADRWGNWADRLVGGLLESFHVGFAAELRDFF
jgi:hypothetical protein